MKRLTLLVFGALLAPLAWIPPALAQSPTGTNAAFAQAERKAVGLKQGMSLEEVQKLLGKPKRTSLKNGGNFGTLYWTYAWTSERTLQVVFAAKAPDQWQVNGWEWSDY